MSRSLRPALLIWCILALGVLPEDPMAAQTPGFGVRLIDVGASTVDTTSDAFDVALNLGNTAKPYRVDRDLTAIVPSFNLGEAGSFGDSLPYPGGYGLPGDESDFVVVASANVTIPAGRWQIAFGSDDGGSLSLGAVSLFGEFGERGPLSSIFPGDDSLLFEDPRGHQWTGGSFVLDEPLSTTLSGVFFERGGSDSFEIAIRSASADTQSSVTPVGGWRILEDGVLDWQVSTALQPGRRIGGQNLVGSEELLSLQLRDATEGEPMQQPGLFAEVYRGNLDSVADWGSVLEQQPFPQSHGVIPNINWANDNGGLAGTGYPEAFGFENPSNQEFYSVRAQGELFIPQSGVVRFKDGNDDYAFLAIDLDGNGIIDSATETLINDDGATGPAGQNSPIAVANFSNVALGGEFRRIDFRMAEDGGFDNGVLYWDQNVGGPAFPTSPGTAASPAHLVPPAAFRTTVTPTLSGELVAVLDSALPLVFDIDAALMTSDQIRLPANPDPARFQNVLDLDGANLVVELLSGALQPGQRFDLIDETNIDAIRGVPTFQFPYGQWDTSSFGLNGEIEFVSGVIEPPQEGPETTWTRPAGGNWHEATNWSAGVPNAPGDMARFDRDTPMTTATITLDAPATIEALHYNNPRVLHLTGSESLVFAGDDHGLPRIELGTSAGTLRISSPLDFSSAPLGVNVARASSELRLNGPIAESSSDLIKSGLGRLVLAGNSENWHGVVTVNGGTVQVQHAHALGSASVPTTLNGGRVLVSTATAEPFLVAGGRLDLAAEAGEVTMFAGQVRLEADVPVPFSSAGSQRGEVHFPVDHTQEIRLPGGTANGAGVRLVGLGTNIYLDRTLSGPISISGESVPLLLGGRTAKLRVRSPLSAESNITSVKIVEGMVQFDTNNTYTGQTIIRAGASLSLFDTGTLGTSDGTPQTGTIVRRGGTLYAQGNSTAANEWIMVDGGRIGGTIQGPVLVQSDSAIISGSFHGPITGPANITFTNGLYGYGTALYAANTFTGQAVVAGEPEHFVQIHHPQALGKSAEPALLVRGQIHLHSVPEKQIVAEGGELHVAVEEFNGDVVLRGGAVLGQLPQTSIQSPLRLDGGTSRIGSVRSERELIVNAPIVGEGHLRVGGINSDDWGSGPVIFNEAPTFDGDLRIVSSLAHFNVGPSMSGALILDRERDPSVFGRAVFHVDAQAPLHLRGGQLLTDPEVTFTATNPVVELAAGEINGNLAGAETLLINTPSEAYFSNIGTSDAEIVIARGSLRVPQQRGLGSNDRGVVVSAPRNAALLLEGRRSSYNDPITLQNARGWLNRGGVVFSGGGELTGDLTSLGEDSIVGIGGSEFTFSGTLRGDNVAFAGEGGTLSMTRPTAHTGVTRIGVGDLDEPIIAMVGNGRVASTSQVEFYGRGELRFDKRESDPRSDMIEDHIPLEMHGGRIALWASYPMDDQVAFERVGPVTTASGSAALSVRGEKAHLAIERLSHQPGATVLFHNQLVNHRLGGSDEFDPRITLDEAPALARGVLGGWAIVGDFEQHDFATYDPANERGITALSRQSRPGQLNGAAANQHVLLTSAPARLSASTTVASLVMDTGAYETLDVNLGGSHLVLATGGLIASRTGFHMRNGSITAGEDAADGMLFIHGYGDHSTMEAAVTDGPAGDVSLVKSGPNILYLHGTNTYSGDTIINQGGVRYNNSEALPAATNVIMNHGWLESENGAIARVASVTLHAGNVAGVEADVYHIESGWLSYPGGSGTITKVSPNRAHIGDFERFTGVLDIQEGVVETLDNSNSSPQIYIRKDGALEFGFGLSSGNRPFRPEIILDGGELSGYGGTYVRPDRIDRPVRVIADSSMSILEEFDHIRLDHGLDLADGVTFTFAGPGVLEIEDRVEVRGEATIQHLLGTIDMRGQWYTDAAANPRVQLMGRPDSLTDEAEFLLAGDNRNFGGDVSIRDLTVRVMEPFALSTGKTFLHEGARVVLEAPSVTGNVVLDGGELITGDQASFIGDIVNGSHMSPGSSPGRLYVEGSFSQDTAGTLMMEIASPLLVGSLYAEQHDHLEATQRMQLDGRLEVHLLHGYQPQEGDVFDLFEFGSLGGTFSTIDVPALPDGLMWDLSQLYTTGGISVVAALLEGDYNGNGLVEQGDLDLVLGHWGSSAASPPTEWVNDLPSGIIDQEELDRVLAGWGRSLAALSAPATLGAVPEPASCLLAVIVLAAALGFGRLPRRGT